MTINNICLLSKKCERFELETGCVNRDKECFKEKASSPQTEQAEASSLSDLVKWTVPSGEIPDGDLLVAVEMGDGELCTGIVYIDDEDNNTLFGCEYGDVWTAFEWKDISFYCLMEDILPAI